MSSVDFKAIVRTFRTVFPHVTVWEATLGDDYLLIGSAQDLSVDYQMLIDHMRDRRLKSDMRKMDIRGAAAFVNNLVMTEEAIAEFTRGAPLHTDDNARLEYSAPKALLQGRSKRLLEELYRYRSKPVDMLRSLKWVEIDARIEKDLSAMLRARKAVLDGFINYGKESAQETIKRFEDALAISPRDYEATGLLAQLYYDIGKNFKDARRPSEATRAYRKSIKAVDNFIAGDRVLLSEHFELEVIYARAHLDLGTIAFNANRLKPAIAAFQKAVSGEVRFAEAHNNLAVAYARLGQEDAALNQYQRAIEPDPLLLSARRNLGNLLLRQAKYPEAIASYHQIQKLKPDFALYNLGLAYFMQNRWAEAEAEWERVLALKPDSDQARQGLKAVRQKMGSH